MAQMLLKAPPTVQAPSASRSRLAALLLALILVAAAASRLAVIQADPPAWMQGAFICDEGWWADAARGKALFNNYFSDDFGTAWLMTPAYTWALEAIYRLLGVGVAQTRLLAAGSELLVIALLAALLWRTAGRRAALLAALLLALSPFYWSYGRVGLLEPLQGLFIAAAFALWVVSPGFGWAALGAGAALGLAVAVKPNAVTLGGFPLALAALGGFAVERAEAPSRAARARLGLQLLLRGLLAALGAALVLGALFIFHVLPNWAAFRPMAVAESAAEAVSWKERVKVPGMLLLTTQMRGAVETPVLWSPARYSPALLLGFWLVLVGVTLRLRGGCAKLFRALEPLEAQALGWALGTFLLLGSSFYQPDRRYILLLPPLAILAALLLARVSRAAPRLPDPDRSGRRRGWLFRMFHAFVLTLPLLALFKAPGTALIMRLGSGVRLGKDPGLDYAAAGSLFMLFWLAPLALLARAPRLADRLSLAALRRPVVLGLVALFMTVEGGVLAAQFLTLGTTTAREQAALAQIVQPGETVLGHIAASLMLPLPVRTVRRVSPFETTPPPNPDVWERLHPRYILDMTVRNYQPMPHFYDDLVAKGKYHLLRRIELGPYEGGLPRYVLILYERE